MDPYGEKRNRLFFYWIRSGANIGLKLRLALIKLPLRANITESLISRIVISRSGSGNTQFSRFISTC